MTAKKHEVDPVIQGSMLAPSPAALATGAVVEMETGYYSTPKAEPAPLTHEQKALKAERNALFFLDRACKTKRNITNMETHQYHLRSGNVKEGTDIPTELARLADVDERGKPIGAIPTAQERYKHFRRQAKITYGESIGVETIMEPESRLVEGVPQEFLIVKAEDPARQAEFVEGFREFDSLYGQLNQAANRDRRRQEISDLI
ncbi:MAG TPA: hypothetical protein VFH99_03180 [Candidatus Saccharimonadales bacterium]|nr:hypothetical protein [Candidatus Saccharimonadales bacterium]